MEYDPVQEKVLGEDDLVGEGWVDTHHFSPDGSVAAATDKVSEMRIEGPSAAAEDSDDDGPALDMDDFVESGMIDEDPVSS